MARLKPKACGNIPVRIGKYIFFHRGDGKPLEFSRDEELLMFYDWYAPKCSQCKTCIHVSEHAMQDWLQKKSYSEEKAREMAHLCQATKMYCPRWREEMGEMRPRNVCDHGLPCPFYEPREGAETGK